MTLVALLACAGKPAHGEWEYVTWTKASNVPVLRYPAHK